LRKLVLILLASSLLAAPRVTKTVNRDWTFQYFPAPEPDVRAAAPQFDDSRWPAVALPHTWSTYETTRDLHPFIRSAAEKDDSYWWYGWGWYRKRFTLGTEYSARLVAAEFDGVQKYARVYLNGELVGEHKGGYTSFSVDLTPRVRFGRENVLALAVSNRRDDLYGHIPPMTAGNFDVYGGIYRDVRLVVRDRLHIPFQGSADYEGGTFVTTAEGRVTVRTWVRNDYPGARPCTLVTTIRDAQRRLVATATARAEIAPGATHRFEQQLGPLEKPSLWSPDSPYLYRVETEVRDGARLADTYASPLGFRSFSWNDAQRRLYVNGQPVVLHGMNRHQEYPWLGDAMPKWMHTRDLEDMRRNLNVNFQRTVHYPNDPLVYDSADRLGTILIEEVPNIKDIAFGRDIQRQNVREMIRRDRNHPSIFIWSMGNETNQPADSAWAWEEDQTRIIYLRRGTNGGDRVMLTDKGLSIENLLRCTVRGWYDDDWHDFPAAARHADSGQVTGTEEWQHFKQAEAGVLGTDQNVVVWLYADHGADREYTASPLLHVNPKGWTDAYRFPKYAYYLWQANYAVKPMVFVHPHGWSARYLGARRDFLVDSNCETVELKVNGRSLGVGKPPVENAHAVAFSGVTVEKGTLTAIGRRGGATVEHRVTLAGPPARIVLKTDPARIPADRSGIAAISADIVDAAGVHVYGAGPTLTWKVEGAATLAGPAVYESDTRKTQAMEGTMYIDAPVANVIRAGAAPGPIRVTVSAPGLAAGEVMLQAVAPPDDRAAGLDEPRLDGAGRLAVARDPSFKPVVVRGRGHIDPIGSDDDGRKKKKK
jgi:hypothetical protein